MFRPRPQRALSVPQLAPSLQANNSVREFARRASLPLAKTDKSNELKLNAASLVSFGPRDKRPNEKALRLLGIDPGLLALVEQPAPQSLADSTQSTDERLTESVDIQDLSGVERQEHCESFAESMFLTCHTESEPDEDDLEISFVSQTSQLTESECE